MRDIITVAKKEIKAFFSDKAILMQMFILPFAIVFGYGMLMSAMWSGMREDHCIQHKCSRGIQLRP